MEPSQNDSAPIPETTKSHFHTTNSGDSVSSNTVTDEEKVIPSKPPTNHGFSKRGWMIIAGSWMISFSTFGYLYAFGVYQDFYTRIFLKDNSPSQIAWIGSLQLSMPFFVGIVAGKLYDAGYFHTMEIAGSAIFVLSAFTLSLAKPLHYYQIFLSQGVGMGIGVGFAAMPILSNTLHQFYERKALATGIVLSGTSAGALIFPIMLNHLLVSIGFAKAVRATAYIVLGFLVVGNCLIRRSERGVQGKDKPPVNIKSFFTDIPYVIAIPGSLMALLGLYFPLIYIQFYAIEHGVNATLAFYSVAIINGMSGVGRLTFNFLADKYGLFNTLIVITLVTSVLVFMVLEIQSSASLVLISVVYGFFSGAWLSVALAAFGSLSRSPAEVGARTGVIVALASLGLLGSAPIQGALLGSELKWQKPTVFSGVLMISGAAIFLVVRMILVKERGTWRV